MSDAKEWGYMKAKVEVLEKQHSELRTQVANLSAEVQTLSKTVMKAVGFVSAIMLLMQGASLYFKLRGNL